MSVQNVSQHSDLVQDRNKIVNITFDSQLCLNQNFTKFRQLFTDRVLGAYAFEVDQNMLQKHHTAPRIANDGNEVPKLNSFCKGIPRVYQADDYALMLKISRSLRRHPGNLQGRLQELALSLANAMLRTSVVNMAGIFNNAFNPDYAGYDGKPLVAADHPDTVGGSHSNICPNADLTEDSLAEAFTQLQLMANEDGTCAGDMDPKYLVAPYQMWGDVTRYTRSSTTPDIAVSDPSTNPAFGIGGGILPRGSGNAMNVIESLNLVPLHSQFLLDPDAWFLLSTNTKLTRVVSEDINIAEQGIEPYTQNLYWVARMAERFVWDNYQGIIGCEGA